MKKSLLIISLALFTGHFVKAQSFNTLWCDKNKKLKDTHHAMLQKATEKGKLNVKVKWGGPNGGSTLTSKNLAITNGTCESCKPLGAIGSKNYEQIWVVKVTDPSKPVTFSWATPGTINYCGDGKLNITTDHYFK